MYQEATIHATAFISLHSHPSGGDMRDIVDLALHFNIRYNAF